MINIEYPVYSFKIKQENNTDFIYDTIRKKWLVLTPEEWVRQNFIQYIIATKKYPKALLSVEKSIKINDTTKRYDIVVYKDNTPWLVVECKAMHIDLNEKTIHQIITYNLHIQANYLVITNGTYTFCYDVVANSWMNEMPDF